MQQLITPKQAAERLGVSTATVRAWARRADNPLPSVIVGVSGTHLRIVATHIDTWLAEEAQRKASQRRVG